MEKVIILNEYNNFDKICRVCLNENELMYKIDLNILEKIYFCTSVKVIPIFLELFIFSGLFKNIVI